MNSEIKKSSHFILFIDDEEKSRKYFQKTFKNHFNILMAENAHKAWDLIEKHHEKIATIVSDQKMPNFTGVQLLHKVKKQYPNIVRILTTAYADLDANINAINQSRVFSYVTKPWKIDDLKSTIYKAISEYESRQKSIGLGASIAHEMRNSLNAVNLMISQIKDVIPDMVLDDIMGTQQENIIKVDDLTDTALNCIKKANNIVNIILTNIKKQKIDKSNFSKLSANSLIKQIVAEYGYANKGEKERITLNLENDFQFKGDETLFTYIFFNLIKNALYYFESYPKARIEITLETQKDKNLIIFKDTGPGIERNKIESIFEPFVTSGKVSGTGLGLPFCQRAMEAFEGNIKCESEVGEFTKFTLSFPKTSRFNDDKKIKTELKILLVDDTQLIIKLMEKMINNHFKNAVIHIARNGVEAVDIIKNNIEYDLVIMDLEMPKMGGLKASEEIRKFNKSIPIIAHTSLENKQNEVRLAGMNDYIVKSNNEALFIRNICKWNVINYLPKIDVELNQVQNKSILLADDNLTSSISFIRKLQTLGYEVDYVKDGEELIHKYMDCVQNGEDYGIIITDANMPNISGEEAILEIRRFEQLNDIKTSKPIITYSGDSQKDEIQKMLKAGATDYFTKGDNINYLTSLLNFWLNNALMLQNISKKPTNPTNVDTPKLVELG